MLRFIILIIAVWTAFSTLVITDPLVTDFPNNTVPYFYANFGEVTYGKTLSFDIQIMESGLCDSPAQYKKIQKPTYIVIKTNYQETCSFTKRAEVAQLIGAKGLIISSPNVDYAQGNVIQSDDGNGKKVHITCLFISSASFDSLKKLNKVEIIAKYPVPQSKVSTVQLFVSASKRSTYVFLRQFKQEYSHLKQYINIEPIYHTINCQGCVNRDCFLDSCCFDYDNFQQDVGQKILKEQLYQYAIYTQKGAEKWMTYMNLFDEYCDGDWNSVQECRKKVLKQMGMNEVQVSSSMDETLRTWKLKQTQIGFDSFPQVAVNSMVYRGNLDTDEIVQTICYSLLSPPKYCQDKISKTTPQKSNNKHVTIILVSTMLALTLVGIISVCCYRNCVRGELTRDMSSRVGEIIANYANKVSTQKMKKQERLVETFDEQL